jgi:hypothetical protein
VVKLISFNGIYLSPLETAMLLNRVRALSSEIFFKMEVIDGALLVRFSMNEVCLDAHHYIGVVSQRDPVKAVTGPKMS